MDWCMANIGIGVPRSKDSMSDPETERRVDVDERKTMSESASTTQRSRQAMSEEEDALNPPDNSDSSSHLSTASKLLKKLPYSLPSPLFSPPASGFNYPLSLLSPQSYFSIPTLLLSLIDSPAYSNLTTRFLEEFNLRTKDDPTVSVLLVFIRA